MCAFCKEHPVKPLDGYNESGGLGDIIEVESSEIFVRGTTLVSIVRIQGAKYDACLRAEILFCPMCGQRLGTDGETYRAQIAVAEEAPWCMT